MNLLPFSKTYTERFGLQIPSLTLIPGHIYCVIGANGSGKSTFARILAGTLAPDKKQSIFAEKCSVGYLPQRNYAFRMSTLNNIYLSGKDTMRADALLDALQIRHLAHQSATRLSGGELARMSLARVLMKKHDLLILDEPTASADMESTIQIEKLLLQYREETPCVILLVTHSLQQARRLADEAIFLYNGVILENGPAEQVLYNPTHDETKQFLDFYGF